MPQGVTDINHESSFIFGAKNKVKLIRIFSIEANLPSTMTKTFFSNVIPAFAQINDDHDVLGSTSDNSKLLMWYAGVTTTTTTEFRLTRRQLAGAKFTRSTSEHIAWIRFLQIARASKKQRITLGVGGTSMTSPDNDAAPRGNLGERNC
ncbi:MAG: hypothetical protein KCHDKBKB_01754 [Elusimicrobia bacterium]|nr:hypothetical protein [Elusimicrobiota bacterium]